MALTQFKALGRVYRGKAGENPTNPASGAIFIQEESNSEEIEKFQLYTAKTGAKTGTGEWIDFVNGGSGGSSIEIVTSDPTTSTEAEEGDMRYNSSNDTLWVLEDVSETTPATETTPAIYEYTWSAVKPQNNLVYNEDFNLDIIGNKGGDPVSANNRIDMSASGTVVIYAGVTSSGDKPSGNIFEIGGVGRSRVVSSKNDMNLWPGWHSSLLRSVIIGANNPSSTTSTRDARGNLQVYGDISLKATHNRSGVAIAASSISSVTALEIETTGTGSDITLDSNGDIYLDKGTTADYIVLNGTSPLTTSPYNNYKIQLRDNVAINGNLHVVGTTTGIPTVIPDTISKANSFTIETTTANDDILVQTRVSGDITLNSASNIYLDKGGTTGYVVLDGLTEQTGTLNNVNRTNYKTQTRDHLYVGKNLAINGNLHVVGTTTGIPTVIPDTISKANSFTIETTTANDDILVQTRVSGDITLNSASNIYLDKGGTTGYVVLDGLTEQTGTLNNVNRTNYKTQTRDHLYVGKNLAINGNLHVVGTTTGIPTVIPDTISKANSFTIETTTANDDILVQTRVSGDITLNSASNIYLDKGGTTGYVVLDGLTEQTGTLNNVNRTNYKTQTRDHLYVGKNLAINGNLHVVGTTTGIYGTDIQSVGTSNDDGNSNTAARSDHVHSGSSSGISYGTSSNIEEVGTGTNSASNDDGDSDRVARADHEHGIDTSLLFQDDFSITTNARNKDIDISAGTTSANQYGNVTLQSYSQRFSNIYLGGRINIHSAESIQMHAGSDNSTYDFVSIKGNKVLINDPSGLLSSTENGYAEDTIIRGGLRVDNLNVTGTTTGISTNVNLANQTDPIVISTTGTSKDIDITTDGNGSDITIRAGNDVLDTSKLTLKAQERLKIESGLTNSNRDFMAIDSNKIFINHRLGLTASLSSGYAGYSEDLIVDKGLRVKDGLVVENGSTSSNVAVMYIDSRRSTAPTTTYAPTLPTGVSHMLGEMVYFSRQNDLYILESYTEHPNTGFSNGNWVKVGSSGSGVSNPLQFSSDFTLQTISNGADIDITSGLNSTHTGSDIALRAYGKGDFRSSAEMRIISDNQDVKIDSGDDIELDANDDILLKPGGDVKVNGNVVHSSDIRVKTDIEKIQDSILLRLDKIIATTFRRVKNDVIEDRKTYGFIAQEVINEFPELVYAEDNTCDMCLTGAHCQEHDYWQLDYNGFIPILVKSLQELHEKYIMQNNRLDDLENKINDIISA